MTVCTAVGFVVNEYGYDAVLADHWTGADWSVSVPESPSENSVFNGVSCASPTSCTAVGYNVDSSGARQTLAEHWDGSSWSAQTTPNPSGETSSLLSGVSCVSATACTAVGQAADTAGTLATLAESWNGKAWSIQPTPHPTNAPSRILSGVS